MPDMDEGLSQTEIDLIRESWQPFAKDLQETGITFFLAFFKRQADYQEAFPFRGVPLSELRQNESFRRHAKAVLQFIDTAIASLENTSEILSMLESNGKSHGRKNLGLTWSHYEHLEFTLLDVIDEFYEQEKRPLSSLEKETWAKFIRSVTSGIYKTVQIHQNAIQS
ncbi:unnamed protein product [Bemisia tabaci]|uniref:Globin domain-containing protein n=1 Tax=Bemisia tabaci TaxID=7038 RepID=A0A9P0A6T9_BEMTA|nr:PREDICTED: non-symbiotic hemoglobin isoform X2 [Bemisia tabaci]CAH0385483.1 unnamed protein product [Bemisia tabaci]